jgi:transmembrane sensor
MTPSSSPKVTYTEAQRRAAADWFVVIHDEHDPKAETLQAWLRWLGAEEGNRVAFEAVAHAWHATPASLAFAMPGTDELRADAYEGDQPVDVWLAKHSFTSEPAARNTNHTSSRGGRVPRWAWLAAASLVVVTVGLIAMNRHLDHLSRPRSDQFATNTGEQVVITLADGSRVWLGPKSKLLVGYTQERRDVQLPAGEAYFSVSKDRSRPFVVRSSSGDITAVGTAFNVRAVADHVIVAVSEGVVTVAPRAQLAISDRTSVRVASGQQVSFTAQESARSLAITQSPEPGERARWRDGILVYRDEPLRDVVLDVARYSGKQLEIADGAVGDLHYSGIVYQGAVDEWTSALPESFPVKIVHEGTREIIEAR